MYQEHLRDFIFLGAPLSSWGGGRPNTTYEIVLMPTPSSATASFSSVDQEHRWFMLMFNSAAFSIFPLRSVMVTYLRTPSYIETFIFENISKIKLSYICRAIVHTVYRAVEIRIGPIAI